MNKLVEKYNNTYHHSFLKNPINDDYFAFSEKMRLNLWLTSSMVVDRVRIQEIQEWF